MRNRITNRHEYFLVGELRNFCVQYKIKNQILSIENNLLKEQTKLSPSTFNIMELKVKLRKEKNKLNTMIVVHDMDYLDIPFDRKTSERRRQWVCKLGSEIEVEAN